MISEITSFCLFSMFNFKRSMQASLCLHLLFYWAGYCYSYFTDLKPKLRNKWFAQKQRQPCLNWLILLFISLIQFGCLLTCQFIELHSIPNCNYDFESKKKITLKYQWAEDKSQKNYLSPQCNITYSVTKQNMNQKATYQIIDEFNSRKINWVRY